jgi:multicomponent Na+:H+ antiporter subunit D
MNIITISWIGLPLFLGFVIYLFPRFACYIALFTACLSAGYGLWVLLSQISLDLLLLDNFGVTLKIDQLSAYFILTNALVTLAVILYCWQTQKTAFFYVQTIILHGSINATFVSFDLISLYVALEVVGICAFLLIAYPRSDRTLWVGLRYLFISNTAMLFYLVGAILVYQASYSFAFTGLSKAPPEAIALIMMALLSKGGVFVSGLWLPLTHSESETPVSALLSGAVVKTGIFPLLRFATMIDELDNIVRVFGVCTALFGVFYAIFERDTKRTLALSTISQLGWIMASPAVGGFYALTHGLAKAAVFLTAGALPSRNFSELEGQRINTRLWLVLLVGGLSITGCPLLAGFTAKALTMKSLLSWQTLIMTIAAIGTAIVYAKFIFLPFGGKQEVRRGFWGGVILLLSCLVIANIVYLPAYNLADLGKSLVIILLGWLAYALIFRKISLNLSRVLEEFEHLIGFMSLMLILLFWMVLI